MPVHEPPASSTAPRRRPLLSLRRRAAIRQPRRRTVRRETVSQAPASPRLRSHSGSAPARTIPYITARKGEADESYLALRASFSSAGGSRISYVDERPGDRDVQGALWARISQSLDEGGTLTGAPVWRMVNPARQRETMSKLLCQFCRVPARMAEGILFLHSIEEGVPDPSTSVRTAQPPFCLKHAREAPKQCSHLAGRGHVALLAQSAPLYGVIGTPHRYMPDRTIQVMASDGVPVPYGAAALDWMVAAQLVRTLRAFTVVNLDDL